MPIATGDGHTHEAEFIGLIPPAQTVQRPAQGMGRVLHLP